MSEEVAMAAADAPTIARQAEEIARLTAQRDAAEKLVSDMRGTFVRMRDERNRLRRADAWASLWRACAKMLRGRLQHQTRRRIYWRTRYREVLEARDQLARELAQARERERIAAEAYNGQQTSYRELETLYQAMTERAQRAEAELERRLPHLNEV